MRMPDPAMNDPPENGCGGRQAVIDDCWKKIGVWGDGSCPELAEHVHCRNCPVFSRAAVTLLEGELPSGYVEEWTKHFAEKGRAEEADGHTVVVFRLGAEWLSLRTAVCKEVVSLRTIHSLPHRRDGVVLGLVNVRGELLICVSLGEVLGLEGSAESMGEGTRGAHRRLLVIGQAGGGQFVFPADEVHGIHRVLPREVRAVPATVARAAATYTKAVLAWRDNAVGCLDDQLLFYVLDRSLG
jgi:chemotaxis-related protein WspD